MYEFFHPHATPSITEAPALPTGLDQGEETKEEDVEGGFPEEQVVEGEEAAAGAEERARPKPKLFKPLVFPPRVTPKGGGGGHGHGHGAPGHGHGAGPSPQKAEEPSVAEASGTIAAAEAVPLTVGGGDTGDKSADLSEGSQEDVAEKFDDSHIIRATRKDYFFTGLLFCVMAALVGVVVGWETHLDESDSIFGPVGLACKTPCRGDLYDQDYFRGRNTFHTGEKTQAYGRISLQHLFMLHPR